MAQSISLPPPTGSSLKGPRGLVYFIPGNPGYIEYYRDFLIALRAVIDSSSIHYHGKRAPSLHVYGRDLAGFQDDDHEPFSSSNPPIGVEGQVETTQRVLRKMCARGVDGEDSRGFDFVVLVGHSLGSYISLCLVHNQKALPFSSRLPIRHAILLFAVISHIALSPRGRIAEPLLNVIPIGLAARVARAVIWPWPRKALRWVLGKALGMEERAAMVTESFLRSRDGVWQALSMAKDEMRVIAEEPWGDGFWRRSEECDEGGRRRRSSREDDRPGRTKSKIRKKKIPRFFVFFGKHDMWVDDEIRDEFIARTRGMGGVKAVVDGHNLPHDFCTTEFHSVLVAALIKDWVRDIQDALVRPEKSPAGSSETVTVKEESGSSRANGKAKKEAHKKADVEQVDDQAEMDHHVRTGLWRWWS